MKTHLAELRKKQGEIEEKSIVIVHTGEGKGKTTAAMGIILRTLVHGWNAAIVQFMKSEKDFKYAEVKLTNYFQNLEIHTLGAGFTWDTNNREHDIKLAAGAWEKSKELINSGKFRTVLLDEIIYAIHYKFLEESHVLDFLANRPSGVNIILTGRNASTALIESADLVTEMKNIKHPYKEKGLLAQKGIDW